MKAIATEDSFSVAMLAFGLGSRAGTVYFSVTIPFKSLFLVRYEYISSNIGPINCTRKKWFPYVDLFIPVVMP